ncbi:hypothetical protein PF003_g37777 [Phytophthora fragariae]|nr:hypothetical protein PF003_g37777 [Phytophthora fragariae]
MPGLIASDFALPSLHAGDTIEAYTQAFVSGDPRGRRVAVILRVSNAADDDYSIGIDNGELILLTIMIKRRIDRFGNQVEAGSALWRKLMTFSLVAGSWEAPTRASLFNVSLQGAIDASVDGTIRQLRGACEETSRTCSQREKDDTENSLRSGTAKRPRPAIQ